MFELSRRGLIGLGAPAGTAALLDSGVTRAMAVEPSGTTGTIKDVEHVVILMQENRAFDSYFASMRGVRGFGDPHPARRRDGESVWHQNDGSKDILPFRPDEKDLGGTFVVDLDHSWKETHEAFNLGWYDRWIQTKTPATMMHYVRSDMPWYYALADNFTICDGYYCSLLGPTDPNRYYMWTGWTGNDGKGGGPDLWNGESGYDWMTYPERLQKAGVSWKIYQDEGMGLDAPGYWGWTSDPYIGNYGDNSLLYFHQYQNSKPGDALYEAARRGTKARAGEDLFSILRADVKGNKLPQVSWICAPEAYTEHGNWPVNYGMWYVANVLDALTSNPDVWSKTALFIIYDENDGFYDHMVPPCANTPQIPGNSTVPTDFEYYEGAKDVPGQFGLGVRVPAFVVSPWTRGGNVCSEVFDATSLIRFLEKRFGITEPQISPWRRSVCGDFTSAFDFGTKTTALGSFPSVAGLAPTDHAKHPDYIPVPPATASMPKQESGTRPSRALGYAFDCNGTVEGSTLHLDLRNTGSLGVQIMTRPIHGKGNPRSYTTGAGTSQQPSVPLDATYEIEAHGPDGLFRRWTGTTANGGLDAALSVSAARRAVTVTLTSQLKSATKVTITNAYGQSMKVEVPPRKQRTVEIALCDGWYDIALTSQKDVSWGRSFAGRVHNGRQGVSDPQLGR